MEGESQLRAWSASSREAGADTAARRACAKGARRPQQQPLAKAANVTHGCGGRSGLVSPEDHGGRQHNHASGGALRLHVRARATPQRQRMQRLAGESYPWCRVCNCTVKSEGLRGASGAGS